MYVVATYDLNKNIEIEHEKFPEWGKTAVDAYYAARWRATRRNFINDENINVLMFDENGKIIFGFEA